MSVAQFLRRVPLFSQLGEPELSRLADVSRERSYPKNSVILFEDDPGDALYMVVAGQVKVVLIGEDGREVILSMLREGDFFGEMIPIQTRMMTIADIFDALTASDRPYKHAVPAPRALDIMSTEVKTGMLDPELFRLFADGKVFEKTD
ncbi:MAG: cyclic nucleotide-binding domain-containing protein [Gemmatimonadetes bacterium]|nr:cyclic nucleotide-binding domain-containing protein [Gemmatimonadota bacterium]